MYSNMDGSGKVNYYNNYFKIEDHFFVFSICVHIIESLHEIISIKVGSGEGDDSRSSMVWEKNEDIIFVSRFKYSSCSFVLNCF